MDDFPEKVTGYNGEFSSSSPSSSISPSLLDDSSSDSLSEDSSVVYGGFCPWVWDPARVEDMSLPSDRFPSNLVGADM